MVVERKNSCLFGETSLELGLDHIHDMNKAHTRNGQGWEPSFTQEGGLRDLELKAFYSPPPHLRVNLIELSFGLRSVSKGERK